MYWPCCYFFNHFVFTNAYVTYQDIKQLGNLRDQTVIVVKAPTDTKLEVPDPDEVCVHLMNPPAGSAMFVETFGEIDQMILHTNILVCVKSCDESAKC